MRVRALARRTGERRDDARNSVEPERRLRWRGLEVEMVRHRVVHRRRGGDAPAARVQAHRPFSRAAGPHLHARGAARGSLGDQRRAERAHGRHPRAALAQGARLLRRRGRDGTRRRLQAPRSARVHASAGPCLSNGCRRPSLSRDGSSSGRRRRMSRSSPPRSPRGVRGGAGRLQRRAPSPPLRQTCFARVGSLLAAALMRSSRRTRAGFPGRRTAIVLRHEAGDRTGAPGGPCHRRARVPGAGVLRRLASSDCDD